MAQAMVFQYRDVTTNGSNTTIFTEVVFRGVDVPGGFNSAEIQATFDTAASLAVIANAIAAAVQAEAVVRGFTVPAGSCLIPSYQKI